MKQFLCILFVLSIFSTMLTGCENNHPQDTDGVSYYITDDLTVTGKSNGDWDIIGTWYSEKGDDFLGDGDGSWLAIQFFNNETFTILEDDFTASNWWNGDAYSHNDTWHTENGIIQLGGDLFKYTISDNILIIETPDGTQYSYTQFDGDLIDYYRQKSTDQST